MINDISIQACKRLLGQENNARISKDASIELSNILEDTALTIAEKAYTLSKHAGRRTIKKEDILLAVYQLENE